MLNIFYHIIFYLLYFYGIILFISIILSWIPNAYNLKIPKMIKQSSDWYLEPFRGILVFGPIDFTPMFGLILYSYITNAVTEIINIL